MKLSYNWLRELLPDLTLVPLELADLLTLHSFETKVGVEYGVPAGIRTVKITKIEKHPNADKLQLTTITAGVNEITLICGAPNIEVGQVVPYSPPGATVFDDEGKELVVEARKIRGVMSEGMLNSLRELGLHHDHGGIWILPADTPLGEELSQLIPRDTILEADITPNRAHDSLSHIGVAREIAALLRLTVAEPNLIDVPKPEAAVDEWKVSVADSRLCPRYLAAVVDDLTVAPSPLWLQARLLSAGGKPINNLVDVTNYVMFEYGNPTHLFDRATLPGKTIGVRPAREKEKLTTLDEIERNLDPQDLVITVDDAPVALAGVMGGKGDAVTEKTALGLLEVANFNAYSIQETSRRMSLRTEASARFSKALDPDLVGTVAKRTLGLLAETAGGVVKGIVDSRPKPLKPRTVSFHPARVGDVAGSDIFTEEQSRRILGLLRCQIDDSNIPWRVTVPTDRLDLLGEHDIVEEIIRVVGLDKIVSAPPENAVPNPLPPNIYWREVVRETLVEAGFTETYNYSFEPEAWAKMAGLAEQAHVALVNPPAPELKNLRVSLLPGLLSHLEKNRDAFQRNVGRAESALFEIGHIYRPGEGGRVPGIVEEVRVAGVIVGATPGLEYVTQKIAEALSIDPPTLANIITPAVVSALKFHLPVTGFEMSLDELLTGVEKEVPTARSLEDIEAQSFVPTTFTSLPKYPSVFRDISLIVDPNVSVEAAQEVIERAGGELVADVDLFDEFELERSDRKSLAFHIEYRAGDHTLTDAEVNPVHANIIATLEAELSAEIR